MGTILKTLFLLLICLPALAQVDSESRTLARQLKRELDFNVEFASLILRVGAQIDIEISGSPNKEAKLEDFLKLEDGQIEKILKSNVMEFAKFYESNITLPEERKGIFRRYFPLMQWRNLSEIFKSSLVGIDGFFKRKGIGVAIGISLGMLCEYSSYFLLYKLGMPELLPIALEIPYGSILTGGPLIYNSFRIKKELKNVLGGSKAYKAYRMQMKESLKKLHMKSPDQILFPLNNLPSKAPQTTMSLVLSKGSWWDSFLTKLGLNTTRLNYPSLKVFMIVNKIDNKAIKWIREHEGLPSYLKIALMTDSILKTESVEIKNKFLSKFGQSFVEVERAPYWIALKDWTQELMNAKNMKKVSHLMAEIPPGVAPEQIIELWDKIILPHYATHFDMNYKAYRKCKEEITILKAIINHEKAPNWNSQFYNEFQTRIGRALRVNIKSCETPEKNILSYLLNTI
jgi:hypothetical protein